MKDIKSGSFHKNLIKGGHYVKNIIGRVSASKRHVGLSVAFMLDGKQKDIKRTKDENGNPFKTEKAAMKARDAVIIQTQAELLQQPKSAKKRMTVAEVYAEYCENGRCGKAYGTTRKQDSLIPRKMHR